MLLQPAFVIWFTIDLFFLCFSQRLHCTSSPTTFFNASEILQISSSFHAFEVADMLVPSTSFKNLFLPILRPPFPIPVLDCTGEPNNERDLFAETLEASAAGQALEGDELAQEGDGVTWEGDGLTRKGDDSC